MADIEGEKVAKTLHQLYNEWCKETKRNGAVLVGGSIQEFFDWLQDKEIKRK